MDSQWIVALVISVVAYFILQNIDDHRSKTKNIPPATTAKKVTLFFFILIVVFVATYLFGVSDAGQRVVNGRFRPMNVATSGGDGYDVSKVNEIHMLKNIREDIHVGSGPFTSHWE